MSNPLDRYPARTVRCRRCGAAMMDSDNCCPDPKCPTNKENDMSSIDDGGPAFPNEGVLPTSDLASMNGMSLRDWFAGQALVTLAADDQTWSQTARAAYTAADAMLAARKK